MGQQASSIYEDTDLLLYMVKIKYIELVQNLNDSDRNGATYLGLAMICLLDAGLEVSQQRLISLLGAGRVQADSQMIQVEQIQY